ncbi:MAG: hypothetical protein ABIQ61_11300 [Ornithinibacter sp.]
MGIIDVALRRPLVTWNTAERGSVASAMELRVVVLAPSRPGCMTRWVGACS